VEVLKLVEVVDRWEVSKLEEEVLEGQMRSGEVEELQQSVVVVH
jgi:hypothetical protein